MEYHGIFTQIHPLTANLQDIFESSPNWSCRILSVTKACIPVPSPDISCLTNLHVVLSNLQNPTKNHGFEPWGANLGGFEVE